MLFSLLKHYLELYITDTAVKVSRSLTVSLLLYLMVLKTISPGCGVRVSLMLFLSCLLLGCTYFIQWLQYDLLEITPGLIVWLSVHINKLVTLFRYIYLKKK